MRLGYGVEAVAVWDVLGVMVMGMDVTIVEPCELVVVRFPNEVLLVAAGLLEFSLPELVLGAGDESEDCAAEGVA